MEIFIYNMKKNKKCFKLDRLIISIAAILSIITLFLGINIFADELDFNNQLYKIIRIIMIVFIVAYSFLYTYLKKQKRKNNKLKLGENGYYINCRINKEEFWVSGYYSTMNYCTYKLVCYYTQGERTYAFSCEIYDKQPELANAIKLIKEDAIFPETILVYVDKTDYSNYEIQIYDYLEKFLVINKELFESAYYHMKRE